jgi:hypothetical protein
MLVVMWRRVALVTMVLTSAAGIFVACGLDESGLESADASLDVGSSDTSFKDTSSDAPFDVVINPGCKTLDATACLDADVPDGWTLVGLATSNTACPSNDYSPAQYVDNLELEAGACSCTCTSSGSYSCAGSYTYAWGGGGGGCMQGTQDASFAAGDDASCVTFNGNDHHFEVYGANPTPTPVDVGCDASLGGMGWTSDPVTTCTPSCAADYCHIAAPFMRCIISTTETTCPAPFVGSQSTSVPAQIGPTGAVAVSCNGCGCSAGPQSGCDASFAAFGSGGCTSFIHAVPLDDCQDWGGNVNSFSYTPNDPPVACQPSGGGGKATFSTPITVCCLP